MSCPTSPSKLALVVAVVGLACPAQAQVGVDPKHENHFKTDEASFEIEEVKVEISGAHAQREFVTMKVKLQNPGNDYIFFHRHEVVFHLEHGDFQPQGGKAKKPVVIEPGGKASKTLKVKGEDGFHVNEFELEIRGLARASTSGETQEAADFQLPASRNDFKAGDLACKLKTLSQETKETKAVFECRNSGKNIAFVDPSLLAVRIENGQEYANDHKKAKRKVLKPGSSTSFTATFHIHPRVVDMQFATMHILWRDTFSSSSLEPLEPETVEFELDSAKTDEEND